MAVPDSAIDAGMATYLEEAFAREHEKTYGHRAGPDEPVELVAIQLVGHGLREGAGVPERLHSSRPEPPRPTPRAAYFGATLGWVDTSILRRSELSAPRRGPLMVEEYDATCLVPAGAQASLDPASNIVIELG